MTVRAAHLALCDLQLDRFPRTPTAPHGRNGLDLVPEVIEVKDSEIGLSAIDTCMREQVIPYPLFDLAMTPLPVPPDAWHLIDTVLCPPLAVVVTSTRAADVLASPAFARSEIELCNGLGDAADAARDRLARSEFHLHYHGALGVRDIDRESSCELSVSAFKSRLSRVAVRATHVAFGDLRRDPRPASAGRDHRCDVERLVTSMVELQHDRVCFTAIDARVLA
jgi:hypothetical protein